MVVAFWILCCLSCYVFCAVLNAVKLMVSRNRRGEPVRSANNKRPARTMVIMGSGGHTGEMVRLLSTLDFQHFSPRLYVIARTDNTSSRRVQHLETARGSTSGSFQIGTISRSREVGQSWATTIISSLLSTLQCMKIVVLYRPDLILCNGPGTCVPPCLVAFILKALWVKSTTIVFVESVCRVNTLSLTGKLMVHLLADRTLVQWPELHAKYPQTVYLGRLV